MTVTVVIIGVVAVFWAIVELMSRRNPELALHRRLVDTLKPYVGSPVDMRYLDKEAMWRAIGGARGVCGAFWAAGAIATLANRCERTNPCARTAAREIFAGALSLRFMAGMSIIEAAICWMVPAFPRAMAGALVRLYCDLVWELEAVEGFTCEAIASTL